MGLEIGHIKIDIEVLTLIAHVPLERGKYNDNNNPNSSCGREKEMLTVTSQAHQLWVVRESLGEAVWLTFAEVGLKRMSFPRGQQVEDIAVRTS